MKTNLENKYKARKPEETINIIENFFKSKNCSLQKIKEWQSEVDTYSCAYGLYFCNKKILQAHGKGTTEIFAKASCYGEMYERFCAFPLSCWNPISCDILQKKLNPKEVNFEEILNGDLEKQYLQLMFSDLNPNTIKQYLSMHFGEKFYKLPYKRISDNKDFPLYSPLIVWANTSNGFSAGNTLDEAIVQGMSELYERQVQALYMTNKQNKYYYINDNILPKYLKDIVNKIKDKGYDIKIYDLSYNFKLPVCLIYLINKKTHNIFTHFGSFPIAEIAVERCLTELYQGIFNNEKEKTKKRFITENEVSLSTLEVKGTSGMYEEEVIIDNLILNSQEISYFNDLIFLPKEEYTNEDLMQQINKINTIHKRDYYYYDLSLIKEMAAVHIVSTNANECIFMKELRELCEEYEINKLNFNNALLTANKIINLIKYFNGDEKQLINNLNDILLFVPTDSEQNRFNFLQLVAYIIGVDITDPYKCWYTREEINNGFLLDILTGLFAESGPDLKSDFNTELIRWNYFYLYCIKNKNTIENYNKIISALGYPAINISKEAFTPASFINEAIIKNFQSIYNSEEYSEFINLFKKE